MRRARIIATLLTLTVTVLTSAPAALASPNNENGGQGWYGETTDKAITNTMFLVIIFFPLLILLLTFIQWRLEKRKHAQLLSRKRRAASADWRGGW
jgi:hypothetical protein